MKSFDRLASENDEGKDNTMLGTWVNLPHNQSPTRRLVRCVPWPEGAPDSKTVPHAGEYVTVSGGKTVYTVFTGIPYLPYASENDWRLRVKASSGAYVSPQVKDISIYEPSVDEPTYTAEEVAEALKECSPELAAAIKAKLEKS